MTAGIIRLIAHRNYTPDLSKDAVLDSRVFDCDGKRPDIAERIASDMTSAGWEVHREEL